VINSGPWLLNTGDWTDNGTAVSGQGARTPGTQHAGCRRKQNLPLFTAYTVSLCQRLMNHPMILLNNLKTLLGSVQNTLMQS
jgi:hypothetical protein